MPSESVFLYIIFPSESRYAPVLNLFTIEDTGSTSSNGIGFASNSKSNNSNDWEMIGKDMKKLQEQANKEKQDRFKSYLNQFQPAGEEPFEFEVLH